MDWVSVAEAPDQITAEMWSELLRNNGVDAFAKLGYGYGYSDVALGPMAPTGCWVMVQESDVDKADAILEPIVEGMNRRRVKRRRARRRRSD